MFISGYSKTGKEFSIAIIKEPFPRKEAKLFIYGTDKIEIITSCKELYKSFVRVISTCFAKKYAFKFFSLKMPAGLK